MARNAFSLRACRLARWGFLSIGSFTQQPTPRRPVLPYVQGKGLVGNPFLTALHAVDQAVLRVGSGQLSILAQLRATAVDPPNPPVGAFGSLTSQIKVAKPPLT